MFDLGGRVALVTGGGSEHGIGRAIAEALARQGAIVAIGDVEQEGAHNAVSKILDQGGQAAAYRLDVTNEKEVGSQIDQIVSDFGRLDILVNNAGVTQPVKVSEMSLQDWRRIMDVNATGTFLCSRAAIRHMENNGYGRIVNISSVSAKRGGGVFGGAHYSAAKAAILGFSKALAREVSSFGITVNSVAPGLVLTDIRGGLEPEEEQARLTRDIPISRMGLPQEVGAVVCFLASDEAAYITGEEIDINGGSHMD